MRFVSLALLVLVGCAPASFSSSPDDWAALADALSSEEYAETFLDELEDRLDEADHDLSHVQQDELYDVLYDGAEAYRALVARFDEEPGAAQRAEAEAAFAASSARTDAAAEGILRPEQVPVYRALQVEVRAALRRQVSSE